MHNYILICMTNFKTIQRYLALLLFSFTLINCSGDDDGEAMGQDPIIGSWVAQQSFPLTIPGDEGATLSFNYNTQIQYNFLANGNMNGSTALSISGDGLSQAEIDVLSASLFEGGANETFNGSWENTSSNPDFSQTTQNYSIVDEGETPEATTLTFNSTFTEFRLPIEADEDSPFGSIEYITFFKQ